MTSSSNYFIVPSAPSDLSSADLNTLAVVENTIDNNVITLPPTNTTYKLLAIQNTASTDITVNVGTVTNASVPTNKAMLVQYSGLGSVPNKTFILSDKYEKVTIAIGTISTGSPAASITGTYPNYILNITMPPVSPIQRATKVTINTVTHAPTIINTSSGITVNSSISSTIGNYHFSAPNAYSAILITPVGGSVQTGTSTDPGTNNFAVNVFGLVGLSIVRNDSDFYLLVIES